MNLFTIIMPAFNRESLICEALDSVRGQTYRPIEIIVVDDGSTDATADVVREWAEVAIGCSPVGGQTTNAKSIKSVTQNQEQGTKCWVLGDDQFKVRYFYQENAGAGAARNRGIDEIRGQYVQYLDSDDRLHPDRLKVLAETFEKEQCDFIQTGFEGFDADTGEIIQTHYGKPGENQLDLVLKGRFWANTLRAALSAELVRRIGPWKTEMTCFEDREYMERALCHSIKPVAIRDVLASARRGGGVRISDRLRSYEGRNWRIYCEEEIAIATRNRSDVSTEAKQEFASRIYALGFRSFVSGWPDLAQRCGLLADSMGVELNRLGRRRRTVYRMGRFGGCVYQGLGWLKTSVKIEER